MKPGEIAVEHAARRFRETGALKRVSVWLGGVVGLGLGHVAQGLTADGVLVTLCESVVGMIAAHFGLPVLAQCLQHLLIPGGQGLGHASLTSDSIAETEAADLNDGMARRRPDAK